MAERIRLNPLGGGGMPKAAPSFPKPSFEAPVHVASMTQTPLHSYLGHFQRPQFMMAGHNTSGHWIQGAIKHPGAEKRAAAKAGMSTHAYMEAHRNSPGKAGARARLGLRLEKMHHG